MVSTVMEIRSYFSPQISNWFSCKVSSVGFDTKGTFVRNISLKLIAVVFSEKEVMTKIF